MHRINLIINSFYSVQQGKSDTQPQSHRQCSREPFQGQSWQMAEREWRDDEQDHPVHVTVLVFAVCQICKDGHCCEPDKLVEAIRHRKEAQNKRYRQSYVQACLQLLTVALIHRIFQNFKSTSFSTISSIESSSDGKKSSPDIVSNSLMLK